MRPRFARSVATLMAVAVEIASISPAFAAPNPAQLAEAKQHMEAGAALYNDPSGHKCEEAYREFKKAYDLSDSLNALKAMGVCALELERDGEAIAHFEKFLELKGDAVSPADKAQVESDLKGLRAAVAWVTITSDRSNVRVGDVRTPSKGYPIRNQYVASAAERKIGVHPGLHVFTASSDGAPDIEWKVDIVNGGTYRYAFEFDKGKPVTDGLDQPDGPTAPAEAERPVPVTVFIFGGLTVALAVPTAIFMVTAKGKNSDYEAANGTLPAPELEDMRSDVATTNLIADVFLGATALSAVATGVFYFTRPEVATEPAKAGDIRFLPAPIPGGGGGSVTVRF